MAERQVDSYDWLRVRDYQSIPKWLLWHWKRFTTMSCDQLMRDTGSVGPIYVVNRCITLLFPPMPVQLNTTGWALVKCWWRASVDFLPLLPCGLPPVTWRFTPIPGGGHQDHGPGRSWGRDRRYSAGDYRVVPVRLSLRHKILRLLPKGEPDGVKLHGSPHLELQPVLITSVQRWRVDKDAIDWGGGALLSRISVIKKKR